MGQKLALEVFVAGRNRLENEGATALSQVFEVYFEPKILVLLVVAIIAIEMCTQQLL